MDFAQEVIVPEDKDFSEFALLCDNNEGWDPAYSRKTLEVWTKRVSGTDFKMIKARVEFSHVAAETVYDVLHDPQYRLQWDKYMLDSKDLGTLNPNNDLCYYCVRCPSPFRNRDFVLQRSWLDRPHEKIIFNHSVCHEDLPPIKGIIRATSYVTGYLVRPLSGGKHSVQLTYVTHSDPKGSLPAWLINKLTKVITPKMIKKVYSTCLRYPEWKAKHNPNHKPWIYPEQLPSARVDISKCIPRNYSQDIIDESSIKENRTTFLAVDDELSNADSDVDFGSKLVENGAVGKSIS